MKRLARALCLAISWPAFVCAQDISSNLPSENAELTGVLSQASLTLALDIESADPQDFVATARADYRRLLTALYAAGHYAGTISIKIDGREAARIAPLDAPSLITTIEFNVDPGPQFTIGARNIGPTPSDTVFPDALVSGAPAQTEVIRSGVNAGIDAWRNNGHAKATVASQRITANHRTQELDILVSLDPGPRLSFGSLAVEGNATIRESAIRRITGLPVGEQFSPKELNDAVRRLRRIAAISSASMVESETIGPNNTLPITVQISEAKPRRIGFGIEVSTLEGLTVSSYWMHRNAFGGAEKFRIDGEISGIGGATGGTDYSLGASLQIPAIYGPDTDFLASFGLNHEDEPDYVLDAINLELSATRILTDDLTANAGIGILTAQEVTALETRRYTLVTLPLGIEYDKRDDPANAKNGYYIDVDLTPFVGLQGGADGGRVYADTRLYKSFGTERTFTIAARGQLGSIAGASATEAPADFLFYSGGGNTVRGQPYHSLSIDQGGSSIGGTSFLGAQLEARVGVSEKLEVVSFFDFGQVGAGTLPNPQDDWHAGAGLGVRYETGIGPIRLDLGLPVNAPVSLSKLQVYIGIGQAF